MELPEWSLRYVSMTRILDWSVRASWPVHRWKLPWPRPTWFRCRHDVRVRVGSQCRHAGRHTRFGCCSSCCMHWDGVSTGVWLHAEGSAVSPIVWCFRCSCVMLLGNARRELCCAICIAALFALCRSTPSAATYCVPDPPIMCVQVEHELRVAQADLVTMLR